MALEQLITRSNQRGMLELQGSLKGAPFAAATRLVLRSNEPHLICTGFPVAGAPETDGPAGSAVLANALAHLGRAVVVLSWSSLLAMMRPLLHAGVGTWAVPVGGPTGKLPRGQAITVEVCGRNARGEYHNMRGTDIAPHAPWWEEAFSGHAAISIGDGGNEFGMGSAPQGWFAKYGVAAPLSTCEVLIPAEVSNWGALGLVAALSKATKRPLLPSPEGYHGVLQHLARQGAVDGFTARPTATEDGQASAVTEEVVASLHRWVNRGPS